MLQADTSAPETLSVATSGTLTTSTTSTAPTSSESMAPRKESSGKQPTKQPWARSLLEDSGTHQRQTRLDIIVAAMKEGKEFIAGGSYAYIGDYGHKAAGMVGNMLGISRLKNAWGTPLAEYVGSINPFDWNQQTRIDERENVTAYTWMVSYAMGKLKDINELESNTAEEISDLQRSTAQKVKELEEKRDAKVKELGAEKTRVVSELQTKLTKDEDAKKAAKREALDQLDKEKREGAAELERQSSELLKVHGKTIGELEKSQIAAQLNTAQAVRANERAIETLKKDKEAQKTAVKDKFKEEFAALQAKGGEDIEAAQVKADHAIEDVQAQAAKDIAAARLHEKTTIEAKTLKQTNEVQAGFAAINACMVYLDIIMVNMKKEEIEPDPEVTNQLFSWIVEAAQKRSDKYAGQLRERAVGLQKTMVHCGVEQDTAAARSLTKLVGKSKSTERKRGSFSSPSPRGSFTNTAASTTTSTTTDTKDLAPIELSTNAVPRASLSSADRASSATTTTTSTTTDGNLTPLASPQPISIAPTDHLAPYSDTVLSPVARHDANAVREEVAPATLTVAQSSALAFGGAEEQANKVASSPTTGGTTLTVVANSNETGVLITPEPSPTLPRSNSFKTGNGDVGAAEENEEMPSQRTRVPSVTAASLEQPVREDSLSTRGDEEEREPMIASLESLPSNASDEPVHSPAVSMGLDEPTIKTVATNENSNSKPQIPLAPQRRKDVTMHITPVETKQEGKTSQDQAKLVKVGATLQFKYAGDSKSHANMGVLVDQGYDPTVMKKDQYPIEVALIHLSTTSLSTPSLYKYMMYSIEKIVAKEGNRKITVDTLNNIVTGHKGYDAGLQQKWTTYVANHGSLEMSLAS